MSPAEQEFLFAIYDLGHGKPSLIPYDELAAKLDTTITGAKSISGVLQYRKLALATFGGVQLTPAGLEEARLARENSYG